MAPLYEIIAYLLSNRVGKSVTEMAETVNNLTDTNAAVGGTGRETGMV